MSKLTPDRRAKAQKVLSRLDIEPNDKLLDYADTVLGSYEDAKEQDWYAGEREDAITEVADQAVPVYNMERLELVSSSPYLWTIKPDLADGSQDIVEFAGLILYQVAEQICREQGEIEKEDAEEEDE